MERGFKYRIYPNESQRDQIARTFGCCRFVYNRALDVKKTAYSETGKSIATNDLIKMIPAWKRDPETSWLAQVDSMALQQSIRDLDRPGGRNRPRRRDACDSLGRHENRESAPSQEIRAQARAGAAQALPQEGCSQGRETVEAVPETAEEGC